MRFVHIIVFLTLVSVTSLGGAVYGIGDIHADVHSLKQVLIGLNLIDNSGRWKGGDSTLVTVGDYLDRGHESRQVIDLLMQLKTQAEASGGHVFSLIGNHEILTLKGHFDYATYEDISSYREFKLGAKGNGYRNAFIGDTIYAKWLRNLPALQKVGDTLFVHAGVSEKMLNYTMEQINEMVRDWVLFFQGVGPEPDKSTRWVIEDSGPLWTRKLAYWADTYKTKIANDNFLEPEILDQILDHFGVKRIAIGHTPIDNLQETIRHPRYDHRVISMDTGLSRSEPILLTGFKIESSTVSAMNFGRKMGDLLETVTTVSPAFQCQQFYR